MPSKKSDVEVVEVHSVKLPESWEAKLQNLGYSIHSADEFGGGVPRLNKDSLVGVPFVIVEIKKHDSKEYGGIFYFCHVVTVDGREGYFSDGGVGIPETLSAFILETGQLGGLLCKNGLSKSEYSPDPETGRPGGTTYYIA